LYIWRGGMRTHRWSHDCDFLTVKDRSRRVGRPHSTDAFRSGQHASRGTYGESGWGWFVAWFALGVMWVLTALGAFTIGIFVLPIAVGGTILLATRHQAGNGIAGLISGLGVPLLYVAFLNRHGPGTICTTSRDGGSSCVDESNPWPWLAIGVALVVVGGFVFVASGHQRRSQPHDT
jgi:hypothetical protein